MLGRNAANSSILLALPIAVCGAGAAFATTDGADLFKRQCAACHTIDPAAAPRQGPPLNGIVGRKSGAIEGFKYSAALAGADLVWDEATLDAWLTNPQKIVKGTTMSYRQSKPEVRATLIEFLKGLE